MSRRRRPKGPSLLDLPPSVFDSMCVSLDSGTVHNWKHLVCHLKDYTMMDVRQLSTVEQKNESATKALLCDLNSRGWTVVDLADLALKSNAVEVVQILSDYCREHHPALRLPGDLGYNNSPSDDNERVWKAAKDCYSRKGYPSTIPPPTDAQDEAVRRYGVAPEEVVINEGSQVRGVSQVSNTTTSQVSSPNTLSQQSQLTNGTDTVLPSDTSEAGTVFSFDALSLSPSLTQVAYSVLDSVTLHFDPRPFRDGGHKLGSGGFGEVFHCELEIRGKMRQVAVKALLTQDELVGGSDLSSASLESTERQQFVTEIQALSNLSHPHLLPVLGYSCDGPRLCLIYPYMANGSLDAHLKDHTLLTPGVRVQVGCDVCSALAYLHCRAQQIVIHRDVKSANILLGVEWRGILGDFGVARTLPTSDHTSLHTTTVVGTRVYMAHEFSQGTISPAADVYAFGVVLFELLTGLCAQNNIRTESGEETDLISYVDDCDDVSQLMGTEWESCKEAWQLLWQLAEGCVEHNRHRRPSSINVLSRLEQILSQTQARH